MESKTILNDGPAADEIAAIVLDCVRQNMYVHTIANCSEVNRDTKLMDDLLFDTLDMADLILEVEERLSENVESVNGVFIPDEVCSDIKTVGDLIDASIQAVGIKQKK